QRQQQQTTHARGVLLLLPLDFFLFSRVDARTVPRQGVKSIPKKGLHGTGHGFHKIGPNLTGLVRTGSGLEKRNTGRDRDREHFHGISLNGNGIIKIPRAHGIIP
ncbi:MAG: hypothetical protein ABJL67_09425, partial [Sulfitobacter sp.]